MDMSEIDNEERELRRKKEIEFRIKQRNSRIFLFFGSVFEIVETIAVILGLFVFFSLLIFRVFNLPEEAAKTIYQASTIIAFVGGLFLGFLIYKNCARFVIEKFKLSDKLTSEVLGHYSKKDDVTKGLKK
ncbi:MAG: hypothetical protein J6X84_04580 [Treponema sp.]|nr:hypothetical protein [Treponema sp.]